MTLNDKIVALAEKIKAEGIPVINIAAYNGGTFAMRMINPNAGTLNCYSITKSFTATAVGIAMDFGKLSISDRVIDFFRRDELPDKLPDGWESVTLHHLLTHTTGQSRGVLFEGDRYNRSLERDWIKRSFSVGLDAPPGERFTYSNSNYFLAAAIVRRATGADTEQFLREHLLDPLEFGACAFERGPSGDIMGATGFFVYTWDMWKLGYVYMSGGLGLDGRRLLSEEWVRMALTDQVGLKDAPRYGYGFWLGDVGRFTCSGTRGQTIRVFPRHDLIFAAHAAGEPDYDSLLAMTFGI